MPVKTRSMTKAASQKRIKKMKSLDATKTTKTTKIRSFMNESQIKKQEQKENIDKFIQEHKKDYDDFIKKYFPEMSILHKLRLID